MRSGNVIVGVSACVSLMVIGPAASQLPARPCMGEPATTFPVHYYEGGDGRDVIVGTGDNDILRGGDGDDIICGRGGKDKLIGGRGDDVLNGGMGSDAPYRSSEGDDFWAVLRGGPGGDLLLGRGGTDRLKGGRGGDELRAGNGSDIGAAVSGSNGYNASWAGGLWGGVGRDDMFGGRGDDHLHGRDRVSGNDTLDGGPDSGYGDGCNSDPDPERRCEH